MDSSGEQSSFSCAQGVFVDQHSDDIFSALELKELTLPKLVQNQVLVKMLAAPIQPADIHSISGRNAFNTSCPFVAGFEGVGEILETGSDVISVAIGDWVVVVGKGTWRTHGVLSCDDVVKIDKRIGLKGAATILLNPTTAYFLLHDFVNLVPGDVIIQNGANGAVGRSLIQIAKSLGIKTINIVRNRAEMNKIEEDLKIIGADIVITDEDFVERGSENAWHHGIESKAKLAVDCVSGDFGGSGMVRHLQDGRCLVSYGAMSQQFLSISPYDLIWRNISIRGFSLIRTLENDNHRSRLVYEVLPYITKLCLDGKFKLPEFELFALENYEDALKKATAGFSNKKQLLIMDPKFME